jgi:hypothetical protein
MDEEAPEQEAAVARDLGRWAPWGLGLAIALVYAPTLGAGWLGYDDDWLVRDNPFLRAPSLEGLAAIWSAFDRRTRLALGAEYLPVRDTSVWIEALAFGPSPLAARVGNLAIYAGACVLVRRWLLALIPGERAVAETAAWLFALHPVHAESVAWIAGRKDVLALFFTAGALAAYASARAPLRRLLVPLLVALACLSKGVSVVLPLLLALYDLARRRRPDLVALGLSLLVAGLALALHLRVGAQIGMIADLPGGSRSAALATMGPVFVRYLGIALGVVPGSLVHEVPVRAPGDPIAIAAWLFLLALAALALGLACRGERLPLVACGLFAFALAPVSQVVAPIQNRMADRYLLVAVLGPCLALALAAIRIAQRAGRIEAVLGAALLLVVPIGALGALRARTFADPEALWSEAIERAPSSPIAPYQRAMLRRDAGDLAGAEADFREALARDGMRTEKGRRAANNLAILLAGTGRADEAIALLEQAVARYPHDPRVRHNLARLLARRGDTARADALEAEIARRFPTYRPGSDDREGGPVSAGEPHSQ